MRNLLILSFLFLANCATETRPNPTPPPEEIEVNVFAENVELVTESVGAVEQGLTCGTWSGRTVANILYSVISVLPYGNATEPPCRPDE